MNATAADLRDEVHKLAEQAFRKKLISGYGDGPEGNEYQIVLMGKPRHLPLTRAHSLLENLIHQSSV